MWTNRVMMREIVISFPKTHNAVNLGELREGLTIQNELISFHTAKYTEGFMKII